MPFCKALAQMLPVRANPVIRHLISPYDVAAGVENHQDMSILVKGANMNGSCPVPHLMYETTHT